MKFVLYLLASLVLTAPTTVLAGQVDPAFALTLGEYNKVNPKQSDLYQRGSRLIQGRILDSQGRTLGDIQDIVFDRSGSIQGLQSSLNRLVGGSAPITLSYSSLGISPEKGSGYKLNESSKQVADLLPSLLSEVETAAGPADTSLSLNKLIGADVASENGTRFGKVEDVIFENNGSYVRSLLVRVNYKTVSGKSLAVPLQSAKYVSKDNGIGVVFTSDQAETIVAFAQAQ